MDSQVIKEMIELAGSGKIVEFRPPLSIKANPHSWPVKVKSVSFERNVEVEYDPMYEPRFCENGKTDWENTDVKVQNTIVQRLRLILFERNKKNDGVFY